MDPLGTKLGPVVEDTKYTEADRVIGEVRGDVYWQWKELKTSFKAAEKQNRLQINAFVRVLCKRCKTCTPEKARVLATAFPLAGSPPAVNYNRFIREVISLFGRE